MEMLITKMQAARSQLITAIQLFFEEADPISIHTLTAASLQILHDHFTDKWSVYDGELVLHQNAIYIKEEYRKKWNDSIREPQNFFKHADKDIKVGKTEIEFNSETTSFHILEAIKCLQILEGVNYDNSSEFQIFFCWFALKYPDLLNGEIKQKTIESLKNTPDSSNLIQFRRLIDIMKGSSISEVLSLKVRHNL